jgi:hypothetical protein
VRVDTYSFDGTAGTEVQVITADSTHFILVYSDGSDDGWVRTFSVDPGYLITEKHGLEFEGTNGTYPTITQLDATTYAICFEGPDDDGHVITIDVDGVTWVSTEVNELEFDTNEFTKPEITMIDSTHFIVAYQGLSGDGYIVSFSCDSGGDNIVQEHSLEHDGSDFDWGSIVKIDTTHVMLVYQGLNAHGYAKSFAVDGVYNLDELDSFKFNSAFAKACAIAQIDTTHYIVVYSDTDGDGQAATLKIE